MENNEITYVKFSPHENNGSLASQLVECYRDVFSDQPWHEWLKCPICQKYWGIKDQAFLAEQKYLHCGVPLVDFWPRNQVISDIFHEITKEASCWLALAGEKVIGFCWGYPITVTALEEKIGISFNDKLKEELEEHNVVAYQDEVGVIPAYRGKKIAKEMIKHRLSDFLQQNLKIGIVRTRQYPKPSNTFLWYKRIGYVVLASYPQEDGRVILGRSFSDLSNLL